MFKISILLSIVSLFIIACNGGSGIFSDSKVITVERGPVLDSIVTDSSGQIAIWNKGTNTYKFRNIVKYPITVNGGFIDVNNNGVKDDSDFDLDYELKTSKGNTVTLITTLIYNKDKSIENNNLNFLSKEFSLTPDELLKLPSTNKKIALLSDIIYKNLELNSNQKINKLMDLLSSKKVDYKYEYDKELVNLNNPNYNKLTPKKFFQEHEQNTLKEIKKINALKATLPKYTGIDLTSRIIKNKASAYIPSQCFTKTKDDSGKVHNPCFACHINSKEPNYNDDWDLQESYSFNKNSHINPFTNIFKDRTSAINSISDQEILQYINQDNYKDKNGNIILASTLKYNLPKQWDYSKDNVKDGVWSGYVPDCYYNFDNEGFDKDNNGDYTGWRAFAYSPFLGTFWPTNGSTDDVLIRLPKSMMLDANGNFSKKVYMINFAIVESMIKRKNIPLGFEVNEADYGVDLNQNGVIDKTSTIVFKWNLPDAISNYPLVIYKNYYVGLAKEKLKTNELNISPGLYPNGTEFLHSVRYIGIDRDKNSITMAKRMKELRYAKKVSWNNYSQLNNVALSEIKEADNYPNRLETFTGNIENGINLNSGWKYEGFIEDKNGNLRPQTYEETLSCAGCHLGIGATTDSTFAFPRKDNTYKNGWYHWSQKSLVGLKDRILPNGKKEYAYYLEQNGAGDEFRGNEEIKNKFFDSKGNLINSEVNKIANDITYLIYPSINRALILDKEYKVIVNEQSYIYGKDVHIKPLNNTVYKEVEIDKPTGIKAIKFK